MANTKIDSIKLAGSTETFDIDLPRTATPSIAGLTTSYLTVTGSTIIASNGFISMNASTVTNIKGTNLLNLASQKRINITAVSTSTSSPSIALTAADITLTAQHQIGLLESFTSNSSPTGGVILKDGALNLTMSATSSTSVSSAQFIGNKDNAQITIGYTNIGYNRISTNPAIVFKYPESSDNGFAGIISLFKDTRQKQSLRIGSRDTTASMGTYYCLDIGDAGFTVDYQENPWTEDDHALINLLTVDKNGLTFNKSNYMHNLVATPKTYTTTISAASQLDPTPSRVTVNYLTADYFISNRCLLLIPTLASGDSPQGTIYTYMRTDLQKKNIYLSIPCYKIAYIYYTDANSITLYYYQSASSSAMTSLDLTSTIKNYGSLYFSNISIITLS